MRKAFVDLIERMTRHETRCLNSDDSISWKAHREAETLADPSMVDELAEYLQNETNKDRRKSGYFILGKLGLKVRSSDCASVLVSHVNSEKDKYTLSVLLDALSGVCKPRDLDLGPLFRRLEEDRWLVRHSAIQSLKHTDSLEAEDQLLHLLEKTSDPGDMTYCHATLKEIGSVKAIPILERHLRSRKVDVKMSAQLAIEAIRARQEK